MDALEIKRQLANVSYSQAIDRYNYLKQRFFIEYSAAANMEEQAVQEWFQENIINEVNENPIEDQEDLTNQLFEQIRAALIETLDGNRQLQQKRTELRQLAVERKNYGSKMFQQEANNILSEDELKQYVIQQLSTMQGANKGFTIEDIVNQVKSYRNKALLSKGGVRSSYKSYGRATKGYFREAMVFNAFSKLSELLEQKTIPVMATGSEKINGKDTLYDTYISFFNNISGNFNLMTTENVDIGYGMQVKSWIAPWEADSLSYWNSKYGFSVGSRADLLSRYQSEIGEMWNWIKGVIFLERYATKAIGENQLGWITGRSFYWTADLIANFRAMNYYLAFNKRSKGTLSATVSWQQEPAFDN